MNKFVVTGIACAAAVGVVVGLKYYMKYKVEKHKGSIEKIKVA